MLNGPDHKHIGASVRVEKSNKDEDMPSEMITDGWSKCFDMRIQEGC
jgi:hypothetical protein